MWLGERRGTDHGRGCGLGLDGACEVIGLHSPAICVRLQYAPKSWRLACISFTGCNPVSPKRAARV